MQEFHNFLDEYSHDLHGLVDISELPKIEGLIQEKDEHVLSLKGIGLGIKTNDVIVYNPNIWRIVLENEEFALSIALALVQNIEYGSGDSADEFCAIAITKVASSVEILEMMFGKTHLIQKFLTSDGIKTNSWKVSLELLDDLEGKAALRLCMNSSITSSYTYGHHNPDFI